jgi:branched-chain amino acid transport system ATP-binding protein
MKQARSEAKELLDFVGLSEKKGRAACDLTFAERRKLELARALATRPDIILLDEVIAGLNTVEVEMTIDMIKKIKRLNITIIFVEHIIKAVMELSTSIVVLDAGRKIAEGPPEDIVRDPVVIKSYLGEEN